jgi:hypothetical protein
MDEADMADRVTEQLVASARAANARALSKVVAPTGFCLNCDEPLADGMRWCDSDCCSDWALRQKRP